MVASLILKNEGGRGGEFIVNVFHLALFSLTADHSKPWRNREDEDQTRLKMSKDPIRTDLKISAVFTA